MDRQDRSTARRELSRGVVTEFAGNVAAVAFLGTVTLATGLLGPITRATAGTVVSVATTVLVALTIVHIFRDSRRHRTGRESRRAAMLRRSRRARNTMGAFTVASVGFIVTGKLTGDTELVNLGTVALLISMASFAMAWKNTSWLQRRAERTSVPRRDVGFAG